MFGKIWRDPVVSSVIGSLIVSLITVLGAYFLGCWPVIKSFFIGVYLYLISPLSVPRWWFSISSIITLFLPTLMVFFFLKTKRRNSALSWKNYKKDNFWSVEWHWKYYVDSIEQISPLCPLCKYQLIYENSYTYNKKTIFTCENCGYSTEISGSFDNIKSRVIRKIQQKIYVGEWNK